MSAFIDTNILVYSVTDDPKKAHAHRAISEGGATSAQVLNEFVGAMRGKLKAEWSVIEFALAQFREIFDAVLPLTGETNSAALALARDHKLSFYDALIVASAMEARCDGLLTEDMQHDRLFGGLRIVNRSSIGEATVGDRVSLTPGRRGAYSRRAAKNSLSISPAWLSLMPP